MGRSARSKSMIRNRNVMREKVFGPVEAARIQRLAEKQRVTTGTVDILAAGDDEEAAAIKAKNKSSIEGGTEDVNMIGNEEKKNLKVTRRVKGKNGKESSSIVRNKKGRVLSRKCAKWTAQKRFK
ncbi:hypothetical protein LPJ66_002004 [Kickxella alabastrina]|uniref:Uncharacterized protein n=1 Tax=Kickxella alabastrina TaxID=61397 RepID=A0ACC1IRL2_9FUNG|nr:hypothetical protein LPJ66_002004 [Kickxella alabastrina]